MYFKLFEEFFSKKFDNVNELPKEGLMTVENNSQLDTLITYFTEKGFENGYSSDKAEEWLKKDWKQELSPGEKVCFQWVSSGYSSDATKQIFVMRITDKEIKEAVSQGIEAFNFEDYFKVKPEYKGWEHGNKYGI